MAIDYRKLLNWHFDDLEHSYSSRDTILYALGLGYGQNPADREELRYVYEDGLAALPMMAVILGYPGFWLKDPETGVDWTKVLHGEQDLVMHAPLPASGTVIGRTRVTGLMDKGTGKGAVLLSERDVFNQPDGAILATLRSTTILRGDGGFGGPAGSLPKPHPIPDRPADMVCEIGTLPQSALIYRLSGDFNPLHADPHVAHGAGFERPILHGLCTYGIAGRAILKTCCGNDAAALKRLAVRFSSPVYPGETIRTEIWHDGKTVSFRSSVVERGIVVLNHGLAEIA